MTIRRSVIAHFSARAWLAIAAVVCVPVYIRLLGVEAWGLAGFFASLLLWMSLLDGGLGQAVGRQMALYTAGACPLEEVRAALRSVETLFLVVGALAAGALWLAAPTLATQWVQPVTLHADEVTTTIRLMAVVIALRFPEALYAGALVGLQRLVRLAVLNIALTTLRWGGAVAVLVWIGDTITAFFAWQLFASIVSVVSLRIALRFAMPPAPATRAHLRAGTLARLWPYAGGVTLTTLLGLMLTQVDKLLLSRLLPLDQYGYYALAALVATGLMQVVAPLSEVMRARLTGLLAAGLPEPVTDTYHTAAQMASVLVTPAGLLLIVCAADVMQLWTGDAAVAAQAATLLSLLALGSLLNAYMYLPYALQLAAGWPGLSARINLGAVAIAVPALLWAAPRYGAYGAAWVWVLINVGYMTAGIHLMHRRLLSPEKWRWYIADVAQPALAAAAGLFAALLLRPSQPSRLELAVWVAGAGLSSMAAAFAAAPRLHSGLRRWLVPHLARD